MSKSIVSEGKTRQEAIDKGLQKLGVSKDRVEIKDVEDGGKRSFYSILAPRIVKVELTVKEGKIEEKIKKEKFEDKVSEQKRPSNNNQKEIDKAVENLKEFLDRFLKDDISYAIKVEDYEIHIDINGENVNYLIGYRGETINNLQVIISSIANKSATARIRTYLDVAGYKEKRIKTLEDLAEKIAKTVIRTGKSISLEPMTAYERKIIHTKLQENNKVDTLSKGEEPYRKIVVTLNK